jgi:hypothetical protein
MLTRFDANLVEEVRLAHPKALGAQLSKRWERVFTSH